MTEYHVRSEHHEENRPQKQVASGLEAGEDEAHS